MKRRLPCVSCRSIKVKCAPLSSVPGLPGETSACARCCRLSISCTYPDSHRSRPDAHPRHVSTNVQSRSIPSSEEIGPQPRTTPKSPIKVVSGSEAQGPHGTLWRSSRQTDVVRHLDPALDESASEADRDFDLEVSHYAPPQRSPSLQDPVSLGFLSVIEASGLYLSDLNPMIALLDPDVHTFAHSRQQTTLLSSILAVTAKFFRKDLYVPLLSHAEVLLQRELATGDPSVSLIKSLLILVFWKPPSDRTAWLKTGIAVRLGYQLGLHRSVTAPGQEEQGNRDRQRTWFCLSCFDRAYSDMHCLPPAIDVSDYLDSRAWVQHPDSLCRHDMHLACSMALAPTHLQWIRYRDSPQISDARWKKTFLLDLGRQCEKHLAEWFPAASTQLSIGIKEAMFLKWWDYSLMINIKSELFSCVNEYEKSAIMHEALALASQFTEQTEQLAHSGCLLYLQDTTAALLSSLGLTLYKLYPTLDGPQRQNTLLMIQTIHNCCTNASAGDATTATAIVARFYRRLVERLDLNSRAVSRRPSISPTRTGEEEADRPMDPEQLPFDVDSFLGPADMFEDRSHDDLYWSSSQAMPFWMLNASLDYDALGGSPKHSAPFV